MPGTGFVVACRVGDDLLLVLRFICVIKTTIMAVTTSTMIPAITAVGTPPSSSLLLVSDDAVTSASSDTATVMSSGAVMPRAVNSALSVAVNVLESVT